MKNLKIATKLLVGFGVVLLTLIIAVAVSFFNMNTMETQIVNYSDYTVPNNNNVWQMRRDMLSVQRYILMAIIDNTQANIQGYIDTSAEESARVQATMTEYMKTTRIDKTKLDQFVKYIDEMKIYREQIAALVLKNDEESNTLAYNIFMDKYKPLLDSSAALLTEIGETQNDMADQQAIDAENAFNSSIIILTIVLVAAVIITIAVTIIITKAILRPVKEVQEVSKAISEGRLDVEITYDGKDELGILASNMSDTTHALQAIIGDVDHLLDAMGNGDFTQSSTCEARYVGQFANILTATKNINSSLSSTLLQINESSNQVSSGAEQVSSGAQALSQGATEQASSVQELAATISEISDKITKNALSAQNAKKETENTGIQVMNSNKQMQEMIAAMNDISGKSAEISKIIKTIEDIAFQTNILALNAAVEAARAGSAGKGFAVVADEVRNLAGKSAEAAKNTTALIEETVKAVENGTKIADNTAQAMLGVVTGSKAVEDMIDNIAIASNEQASAIAQVTQGVDQISAVVQTNSATAEQSAAASEELSGQAQILKDLVSRFNLNENDSKSKISLY